MPGIHYDACLDHSKYIAYKVGITPAEIETMWHFDECDLTNLYRDGFWRWFFSSIRCNCECHKLALTDDEVFKTDLRVKTAAWMMLLVPLLALILIVNT